MYEIIFYQDSKGCSELLSFIEMLTQKASTSKHERIMLKQIRLYINILETLGTKAGEYFVKHIQDEIWELRPGNSKILFFVWKENSIILLHHFKRITDKTPKVQINKALNEIMDWKGRNN